MWAATQPKVMTTTCDNLEAWIKDMFTRCQGNHTAAIVLRDTEVEAITESLHRHSSVPSGTEDFLQPLQSVAETEELMRRAF